MGKAAFRRAAKRDANEKEIVAALQRVGASVERLNQPVDLLIGFRGETHLAEVKSAKGKLNANQVEFVETWRGSVVAELRCEQDVIDWVNEKAKRGTV